MLKFCGVIFFYILCLPGAFAQQPTDSTKTVPFNQPDSSGIIHQLEGRSYFYERHYAGFLQPLGWVSDYEHDFSGTEKKYLDSLVANFEKQTGYEVAIVTLDSAMIPYGNMDSVIRNIAEIWGVGKQAKANGVLIGISATLRKLRIENGYGVALILDDEKTKEIVDDIIIPEFKKGNYFAGLQKGVLAIMTMLK